MQEADSREDQRAVGELRRARVSSSTAKATSPDTTRSSVDVTLTWVAPPSGRRLTGDFLRCLEPGYQAG